MGPLDDVLIDGNLILSSWSDLVDSLGNLDPLWISVLTIAAVGIGIATLILDLPRPSGRHIGWKAVTVNLIDSSARVFRDISIRHRNERILSLSISRVVVWNNGTKPIKDHDFRTANPLRIEVPHGQRILSAEVIAAAPRRADSLPRLQEDGKSAILQLPTLAPGHGVVVEVMHTAMRNRSIMVRGDIDDVRRIQRIGAANDGDAHLRSSSSDPLFTCLVTLWLLPLLIFLVPVWIVGKAALSMLAHIRARGLSRRTIPPTLDLFHDDMTMPRLLRWWQVLDTLRAVRSGWFHRRVCKQLAAVLEWDEDLTIGNSGQWLAGNRSTIVERLDQSVIVLSRRRPDRRGYRLVQSVIYRSRSLSAGGVVLVLEQEGSDETMEYLRRVLGRIGIPVAIVPWRSGRSPARLRMSLSSLLGLAESASADDAAAPRPRGTRSG